MEQSSGLFAIIGSKLCKVSKIVVWSAPHLNVREFVEKTKIADGFYI